MRVAAILLSALLLAAACGGGGSDDVTLTESDSGSTVQAEVGEDLVVQLEANPTTGYQWQLADGLDTDVVEKVSNSYAQGGEEGVAGAGGIDTWTFKAVGPGTTTITLDYLRTFEANSTTNTFTLTVSVAD